MKVRFVMPLGSQGWQKDLEMPAAPRQGDAVNLGSDDGDEEHVVRSVVWYPEDPRFDVYVVLRPPR